MDLTIHEVLPYNLNVDKQKRGRKPTGRPRRKPFSVKLTDEELQTLKADAQRMGITAGELMRRRGLGIQGG